MKINSSKKLGKVRKIDFKKKILKTLREEHNMMWKILQKPFQEHNSRFEKDQEVDKIFKKFKKIKLKKRKLSKESVKITNSRS